MPADRRVMSLSLDLDNLWTYMKAHGDAGWQSFPTYLDDVIPIVLGILDSLKLKITFFIVGQDAALERNAKALAAITAAGHEIANHSFHHEQWLHLRSRAELDGEIEQAEKAIKGATGRQPRGFRGPGYSLSADVLAVLAERGYLYDASTLPTFIGPLARAYYFRNGNRLSAVERDQRNRLFGSFRDGLRPLKPYLWNAGGRDLLEIPVTTIPIVRVPFHQSYLLYLAGFSRSLAMGYLNAALTLCRATGTQPSFLIHPLDFLGGDKVRELAFFPGMGLSTAFKLDFFLQVLAVIRRRFRPVTMEEHALLARRTLPAARPPAGRIYAS
jgi:peptidoglycan/xylan/chitin deacetylase (PgdA/CDA1 family)